MKVNVIRLLIYLKYINKDNTSIFGWMLNMDTGNPILYKIQRTGEGGWEQKNQPLGCLRHLAVAPDFD